MITSSKISKRKKRSQRLAFGLFRLTSLLVVAILVWILGFIIVKGAGVVSWEFLTSMPENGMTEGGILPAIVGTLCLVAGSIAVAFPLGVMSGIYVSEYARDNWLVRVIRVMTSNLSGVPSIVFGLFGMALFVRTLGFGDSIIAGSLTLALLVLPIVIRTTEEAMRRSTTRLARQPRTRRHQTANVRRVLLPMAMPNIVTGLILSIGRVSGETAPILFTAAAYFLPKLPDSIFDQVMALPYHLYVIATSGTDLEASRPMAYGTALVLIAIVLLINLLANGLRRYFGRKVKTN